MKKRKNKISFIADFNLKSKHIIYMFLFAFLLQFPAFKIHAQNVGLKVKTVSGTVKDLSAEALLGVSVIVKGSSQGTITNVKGEYSIDNLTEDSKLIFSYVGMQSQEITVGSKSTITVVLEESAVTIAEFVAVGYGMQSKRKVTGAISNVKSEALTAFPTTNPVQALQGQAAGVTIINSGSPGANPTVRVRGIGTIGDNNPVYVVDGVLTNSIANLNASDIESISVLKDASTAAIYGSLGANGVLVVTTKKGKEGAVKLTFDSYLGIQFKPKTLELLNSEQYIKYATEMQAKVAPTPLPIPTRFTDPAYVNYIKNNTDWQDAIFQSGLTSNYNLSLMAGNENSRVRFSTGYMSQDGILLKTNAEKFTFRTNSEFTLGKLTIVENLSVAIGRRSPLVEANGRSPLENAIKMAPYIPIYEPLNLGGFKGPDAIDGQDARNPVRTLILEDHLNATSAIIGNISGKLDIVDGLSYNFLAGLDYMNSNFNKFSSPFYDGTKHSQASSIIEKTAFSNTSVIMNNSLKYQKTFDNKHNLDVLVLAENQHSTDNYMKGSGGSALSNTFDQLVNGVANSSLNEYLRIGYLARVNYDYDEKYLFAASVRVDGSSRFGSNNRWGKFPSFAAGWIVSEEDFWTLNPTVSYLKLRGSWGIAGNDKIGNYGYASTLSPTYNYGLTTTGVAASNIPNPDLKWEATTMQNVGFDVSFFKNALTLSAEYYKNISNDLLIGVPPASSIGVLENTFRNVGGMNSSGFEINLGYNETIKDFKWAANLNLSTTHNVVTKLSPNADTYFGGAYYGGGEISRIIVNEPLWHFYGYQTDGIFQNQAEIDAAATQPNSKPGDIRFKDLNNDKIIDAKDRTNIGNPFPALSYGMSLNASFKGFDMNVLISGVSGNKIFNVNRFFLDGSDKIYNAGTIVLNRWTGEGTSNTVPRIVTGDPNKNTRISDRYVEDGSYVRLRDLTIGYSISNNNLKSLTRGTISKLRLYVGSQNLVTLTKYTGYNPEVGSSNESNVELGIDRGMYPQPTSIIGGLQIEF